MVTIASLSQAITFPAIADRLISDGPFTLNATASSGLTISYIISGPAILNGANVALTGAEGTVTVTAFQSGNTNYSAATSVTRTFQVSSRPAPGIYFGTFAGDRADASFALLVRPDYSAVFAGYLPTLNIGFTACVLVK